MKVDLPDAGDLNRRVTIRLQQDIPNAVFGINQTFDVGIKRWAKREPIHSLAIRAGTSGSGINTAETPTDLFWVRWATGTKPEDMSTNHVIELEGMRYRVIDSIDVGGLHLFTRLSAKNIGAVT